MSQIEKARRYMFDALTKGPQTARQLAEGAGVNLKYMGGILHAAKRDGEISAKRVGNFFDYYIGDTAPKPKPTKAKARHNIPTKSVTVPALTRLGLFEPVKITLPREPWEVRV